MEFTAVLIKIVGLISEASRNVEKLPAGLITSGIVQAAAALALAVFRSPSGIFVGHGKAPLPVLRHPHRRHNLWIRGGFCRLLRVR